MEYYDHEPTAIDGCDPSTHLIRRWKAVLANKDEIETSAQQWMILRQQIPWTSVNIASYSTGDMAGPNKVEDSSQEHSGKVNLTGPEAKEIAEGMIITFDFFPDSFTASRTIDHGAAVAARHVVEHFQYHKSIPVAWRDAIAAQFLVVWKRKVLNEKITEEGKIGKHLGKRKHGKSTIIYRKTNALTYMLENWDTELVPEFTRMYTSLKTIITV